MKQLIIEAIIEQTYNPTDDEFRIIKKRGYRYKIMNTPERLEWFLKQLEKARLQANRKPWSPTPVKRQLTCFNRDAAEKRLRDDNY